MGNNYNIFLGTHFHRKYKKLVVRNLVLENKVKKVLKLLKTDPFYPSLRTHSINHGMVGRVYSSWITGDIRILWKFENDGGAVIILALDIGGHSGKAAVYRN